MRSVGVGVEEMKPQDLRGMHCTHFFQELPRLLLMLRPYTSAEKFDSRTAKA